MTAHSVIQAYNASQENMSRLAYRTAYFHRVQHRHFPKTEEAIFAKTKAKGVTVKRQSLKDQYAMAKFMTVMLSKEKH